LIIRFFGSYSFRIYEAEPIYFLVMKNVVDANFPVQARYDIKGSTVNRCVGSPHLENPVKVAGKDVDLTRTFLLQESQRLALLETIRQDTEFLRSMNIMDYSLLLAVHYENPANYSSENGLLAGNLAVLPRCRMSIRDMHEIFTTFFHLAVRLME